MKRMLLTATPAMLAAPAFAGVGVSSISVNPISMATTIMGTITTIIK